MNNIVLSESELEELERFGRYIETLALINVLDDNGNELRPVIQSLDGLYKEMLERIKS